MSDWIAAIRAAGGDGPVALVTVLATEGSAPRGAGARMAVTAGATAGSIGGGALELRATEQARALLDHPAGSWRVQDYPLGPLLGQCCGGRVRLLVERLAVARDWLDAAGRGEPLAATLEAGCVARAPLGGADGLARPSARGERPAEGLRYLEPPDEPARRLLLFGAGHVGRAIARLLPGLPVDCGWYDSRPEAQADGVVLADEDALVACAGEAEAEQAVLILTHDHALDYRLTAAALGSRAGFVGLIGSATKRARFLARLKRDGLAAQAARLTCPIGVPGIAGKRPETIAIAAVAQLLALDTAN